MRRTRFDDWDCPIARTVDILGDWWTPMVIRSAFLGARRFETAGHPRHAVLGTRAVALVLRWRFGVRLRDLGPFRAIRRDALLALELADRSFGWPVEMVARAARAGLRIAEVDVAHRPRLGGRSKVAGNLTGSLRAGWRFVRVALREAR